MEEVTRHWPSFWSGVWVGAWAMLSLLLVLITSFNNLCLWLTLRQYDRGVYVTKGNDCVFLYPRTPKAREVVSAVCCGNSVYNNGRRTWLFGGFKVPENVASAVMDAVRRHPDAPMQIVEG